MAKNKPVLTIRLGSHIPDVKIGVMAPKQTAYPADYVSDFRRNLPSNPNLLLEEKKHEENAANRERALGVLLDSFRRKPTSKSRREQE